MRRTAPIVLWGKMVNCLIVIWDRDLRFDTDVKILDDYELSMRCLFKNGLVCADGRYLVEQLGGTMGTVGGGITLTRTRENLVKDQELLVRKYGRLVDRWAQNKEDGIYGYK